jgi:dipeptidyl aminopeptidase/acylaminoacyl peptidase
MTTGFSSMIYYREVFGPDIELSEVRKAELQSQIPAIPGLDIFFLVEGVRQHVDVNGQFIKSLVWSPTSQQIAITTDSEGDDYGIYVYDVRLETLSRISDAYHDLWFREYVPSWSPDSEWLAFRSPSGYSIQHISSEQIIRLDTIMNQSQTLLWSPVKNDDITVCDNN